MYMYKPESILKNEMHKIRWNFDIKIYHIIPITRMDRVTAAKKLMAFQIVYFAITPDHRLKIPANNSKTGI